MTERGLPGDRIALTLAAAELIRQAAAITGR